MKSPAVAVAHQVPPAGMTLLPRYTGLCSMGPFNFRKAVCPCRGDGSDWAQHGKGSKATHSIDRPSKIAPGESI